MFKIAKQLSLPAEAVTQAFAILGRRGSGKTNTAVVMAEEMLRSNFPVVILDPLGVWWGLRSSADGKGDGYPVVIFGGDHADVPLEKTGGKLVADFVVSERVPVILDLFHLGENDMRRFVADFATQFYKTNKKAIHWFVDEADEFSPQNPTGGPGATCLGAMQNIVRRGRAKGIGVTLITQRSAVLNKSVLTQTECLIAMQTTGPHDLKAIDEWIKYHGTAAERDKIMKSLTGLQQGDGWVYSPAWLKLLEQVHIRARHTFDSSRTPKPGEDRREPKRIADVDLGRVQKQMAATVEFAKANDPKELRRRIAELERQVKQGSIDPSAIAAAEERGRKAGYAESQNEIRHLQTAVEDRNGRLSRIEQLAHLNGAAVVYSAPTKLRTSPPVAKAPVKPAPASGLKRPSTAEDSSTLGKCELAILRVLSQYPDGCTAGKLALLSGYRFSGGFRNSLSTLRTAGLIDGSNTGLMKITAAGLAVDNFEPLPTGPELAEYWLTHSSFGKCERSILSTLIDHPEGLDANALAGATGYEFSGGFRNALSVLRTAGVLIGKNTEVMQASEELL